MSCRLALLLLLLVAEPAWAFGPRVVGEEVAIRHEVRIPSARARIDAPRLVDSHVLTHPGASYISAHFSRFRLGEGDHLVVRSPDGRQSWRYEGLGRGELGLSPGGFWSSRILGDTAVLELFSVQAGGGEGYTLDRFARGLPGVEPPEPDPVSPFSICGPDDADWARCYQGDEPGIYEHSRAVARLWIQGTLACTGWLVGCGGDLLTNQHCITNASDALNTDYEFMAEGATCQNGCFSLLACPGTIAATSGTLVQSSGPLDFSLVRLPGNPSGTYGYLRLRESGPVLDERVYVPQHPEGWGKRIAVHSSSPLDQTGMCEVASLDEPPCEGGSGDVGYFADTRDGSSGAPVVAYADHRAVALHHCGGCPNQGINVVDLIGALGPNVPPCALEQPDGTVTLDRPSYSCSDGIVVTVEDDSIVGAGSQEVTIASPSEPVEELLLLEVQPGVFQGSLTATSGAAVPGDGLLSVAHGETMVVNYVDEDDGLGGTDVPRQDSAGVDCLAPVISNVSASGISATTAHVTWSTDEPSDSVVHYGPTPPGSQTASSLAPVTSHGIALEDLASCATYHFSVASEDLVGNAAADDNDGGFYSFSTACSAPEPVPAGGPGTAPLRLRKDLGSALRLVWDQGCPPPLTNVLYGPLDQVSTWSISGAACDVEPPFLLTPPAGSIWILLVGANGVGVESSWGSSTSGERNGMVASGQCGVLSKDVSASCP